MVSAFDAAFKVMLHNYYQVACGPVILEVDLYLKKHGIDPETAKAHAGTVSGFHCTFDKEGYFAFDANGEQSLVFEVLDEDASTTIDLCAFSVTDPARFATAMGNAPVLGMTNIINPASWALDKKLRVHRRPLEWLHDGCAGTVILDYRQAPACLAMRLGDLLAEDAAHARELRSMLCTPLIDPTTILFPRTTTRSAAR